VEEDRVVVAFWVVYQIGVFKVWEQGEREGDRSCHLKP
jgi:hypothetical protein